ncbi:MAG: N-acetylmuramoyl-L-alanine amidase [Pseudomonadota bacterium]|nr:N-acetylmuramoyl-L-alanine amidase [Pseudomonadota bacterium]
MENKRRNFFTRLLGLSGFAILPSFVKAADSAVHVQSIRLSSQDGVTRLVFDLDSPVQHKLFALHDPERVVLDLQRSRLLNAGLLDDMRSGLLKSVRSGVRNVDDLRVVLDLSGKTQPSSFYLKPDKGEGHRLVIELKDPNFAAPVKQQEMRDVIIAIDAGHGGNDPGASGKLGTQEKQITLEIARKLEKEINDKPGMKAVMVRTSDRYMRLRDRIKKARDQNADLMVSIHADAFPDPRASGASVFALSVSGATSETARLLAEKENNVDMLFGNISLEDKDEMVQQVILDLSLTGTIQSSLDVGDEILAELSKVGNVHRQRVQQAGFAVLKAPNIPAILLETAFISNPREERKLRTPAHQTNVAKAVLRGVNDYFVRKAPPGTWLAQKGKVYTVRKGESLADISEKFGVPVKHIRTRNAIHGDQLKPGRELVIPQVV